MAHALTLWHDRRGRWERGRLSTAADVSGPAGRREGLTGTGKAPMPTERTGEESAEADADVDRGGGGAEGGGGLGRTAAAPTQADHEPRQGGGASGQVACGSRFPRGGRLDGRPGGGGLYRGSRHDALPKETAAPPATPGSARWLPSSMGRRVGHWRATHALADTGYSVGGVAAPSPPPLWRHGHDRYAGASTPGGGGRDTAGRFGKELTPVPFNRSSIPPFVGPPPRGNEKGRVRMEPFRGWVGRWQGAGVGREGDPTVRNHAPTPRSLAL